MIPAIEVPECNRLVLHAMDVPNRKGKLMNRRISLLAVLTCALVPTAFGQSTSLFDGCTNSSGAIAQKLVCQFPFSVGLYNNATALGATSTTTPKAAVMATIFNSAIATQVSQLPVSTATAGTNLLYENGAYKTFNNQGPILTDRPQTVGRNHVFLGASASQYVFNSIDGQSLGSLQFAYARTAANGSTTFTTEQTKLAFRLNQFLIIATYGLTDRLDASVIVPIERISIGASASEIDNWVVSGTNSFGPYLTTLPYTHGSASGVGDVIFNLKYMVWNGSFKSKPANDPEGASRPGRTSASVGMNFREPFGDDLNLLGSGAFGINPYLVASYVAKISPHAKIGYQWNGATELNPSIVTTTTIGTSGVTINQSAGPNQAMPGGMLYDIGADWAAKKKLTVAVDLMGNQYLNSTVLSVSQATIQLSSVLAGAGGCAASGTTAVPTLTCTSTTYDTKSFTINKLSTGVKWNPTRDIVFSANLLTQLNNNGLRSRPVPQLGVSYKF